MHLLRKYKAVIIRKWNLNNLLKVIDYELPPEGRTVIVEYPQIAPKEKTKIGDILIGSNGYIGRITALETDSDNLVSSATILGLDYNIIQDILPAITVDDNYKVLTVKDGVWLKDYINRTNKNLEIYDIIKIYGRVEKRFDNYQIIVSKIINLTKNKKE